uniref:Cytidine deaminase n=1 Tax=Callorhinchus milii TaxID=7868 RepID=K4GBC7_CALMI|nr:cytidine deaminase [Callorhinchus milii]
MNSLITLCCVALAAFVVVESRLTHRTFRLPIDNLHILREDQLDKILNVRNGRGAGRFHRDCFAESRSGDMKSGLYTIKPKGYRMIVVYCEMELAGGGWTVVQKNTKGTDVSWAEDWSSYRHGFGDAESDHWLGDEHVHYITKQSQYQLKFILTDSKNKQIEINYRDFKIGSQKDSYPLRLGTIYNSSVTFDHLTETDASGIHDNMPFSTVDKENNKANCATQFGGGWWFDHCRSVMVNSKENIYWDGLCDGGCKSVVMLIRPNTDNCPHISYENARNF